MANNTNKRKKRQPFSLVDADNSASTHAVVTRKIKPERHVSGTSDATIREAQKAAKQRNQVLLKSGDHLVELTIGAGETPIDSDEAAIPETAQFEYVEIPAGEILDRTTVFKGNARFQSNLNQYSLFDIYSSIKSTGQSYPAVGYYDENGNIVVVEGSRRRWTCHLTNQMFKVLVTRTMLTMKNALYLSEVSHAKQDLSLFEKGCIYQRLLDDGSCSTASEVANLMNTSDALVGYARQAFNMPDYLITKIPAIGTLGRPSIKKLTDALTLAEDANEVADLKQYIEALTLKALQAEVSEGGTHEETLFQTGNKLNKKFVSDIVKYAKSLGKTEQKTKRTRRESVAKNGESMCFIAATSKGFNLITENVTKEKKAAILAAIKDIIEQ